MYLLVEKEDTIRISPERLGEELGKVMEQTAKESFEGKISEGSIILLVRKVKPLGSGKIVHGEGGVYQQVKYEAVLMKPELQEVIEGYVCEILRFGAFVRFGPLDALLHVSQIMDERIDYDEKNQMLVGKETKRKLKVGDIVRARIVAVSLNDISPRESKIGLTMRQPGLGKLEWLEKEKKK